MAREKEVTPPRPGETWRQQAGGNLFTVEAIANERAEPQGLPRTVVYRDGNGALWSRPEQEFLDLFRFAFDPKPSRSRRAKRHEPETPAPTLAASPHPADSVFHYSRTCPLPSSEPAPVSSDVESGGGGSFDGGGASGRW